MIEFQGKHENNKGQTVLEFVTDEKIEDDTVFVYGDKEYPITATMIDKMDGFGETLTWSVYCIGDDEDNIEYDEEDDTDD